MLLKNKRGGVPENVFMWVFATFMYFTIGYDIFKEVVVSVFLPNNPTGVMYFLGLFAPFVPILGLMFWGYTIIGGDN